VTHAYDGAAHNRAHASFRGLEDGLRRRSGRSFDDVTPDAFSVSESPTAHDALSAIRAATEAGRRD